MSVLNTSGARSGADPQTPTARLFQPVRLGRYDLPHRIVLAPLTRSRARQPGNVPTALNACYYAQRASAALLVSEATQVSMQGQGYAWTPGIHSREQVDGWRLVTDAMHKAGGLVFLQLWHVGRISHPSLQPDGAAPVGPSALQPPGQTMTAQGMQPFVMPRALETHEIASVVDDYRRGAANAKLAGFDGVALLLEPFGEVALLHRGRERGHQDIDRHDLAPRQRLQTARAASTMFSGCGRAMRSRFAA